MSSSQSAGKKLSSDWGYLLNLDQNQSGSLSKPGDLSDYCVLTQRTKQEYEAAMEKAHMEKILSGLNLLPVLILSKKSLC